MSSQGKNDFADDLEDPIPRVGVIDVVTELDNGEQLCGLVIAKPIFSSKESLRRLVQKVQNYIRELAPIAKTKRVRVDFVVHPATGPQAMNVIRECGAWLEENHIGATIRLLNPDELPPLPRKTEGH